MTSACHKKARGPGRLQTEPPTVKSDVLMTAVNQARRIPHKRKQHNRLNEASGDTNTYSEHKENNQA